MKAGTDLEPQNYMYLSAPEVDRLCGDTCSYVCPQARLNEASTNICLSPTMGFLNENDCLDYFAIFGELSSGLSFTVGFFKTFSFLSLLVGFFRGKEGQISRHPNVLVGLRKPNIRREFFWLSALNLKNVPYNGHFRETLDRVHVKYIVPKGAFMPKTVAIFVQKVGLIWLKGGFLRQLFRSQMYLLA